jgi:hypothetical protein
VAVAGDLDAMLLPLAPRNSVQVVVIRGTWIEFPPDAFQSRGQGEGCGKVRISSAIGIARFATAASYHYILVHT